MLPEAVTHIADQLGGGFIAGNGQQNAKADHVFMGQLALAFSLQHRTENIIHALKFFRQLRCQLVEVFTEIEIGIDIALVQTELAVLPINQVVSPAPNGVLIFFRHVNHGGDHIHRQQGREILGQIHVALFQVRRDQTDGFVANVLLQRINPLGQHQRLNQFANASVVGRVHIDKHGVAGVGILLRFQGGAGSAAEGLDIAEGLVAVVPLTQQPVTMLFVIVHWRMFAQPGVIGIGVVVDLVCVGVKMDLTAFCSRHRLSSSWSLTGNRITRKHYATTAAP